MQKLIRNKIVALFIIIGTVAIGLIGYIYIRQISNISDVEQIITVSKKYLVIFLILFISFIIIISEALKKTMKKSIVDATTLKMSEHIKSVDRQKNQIETILQYVTDGIIAFDLEGQVTHINIAAKRLLNLSDNDKNFESIFSKFGVDINLEKIIYLEDWTSSDKKVDIDGKYINLLFVPYKDNNQRHAGVIAVAQDITEHVKLDNMRKEFVADVSHELKTPITSIMGYADTLLEGEYDDATKTKFLNVIASEARRMAKLVTDLLALSRYDTNKNKIEKTEFDLGDLVKKCQEKLQIEIDKKHHKVENLVTANVPLVYADKSGIERVVLNILSNSIKYTKEDTDLCCICL